MLLETDIQVPEFRTAGRRLDSSRANVSIYRFEVDDGPAGDVQGEAVHGQEGRLLTGEAYSKSGKVHRQAAPQCFNKGFLSRPTRQKRAAPISGGDRGERCIFSRGEV